MNDTPKDLKCPFRATLMTRAFACMCAEEITRREGPDIACNSADANKTCVELYNQLKVRALNDMGHEDDLTTLPASVLQKIQFGGLLGLQSQVDGAAQSDRVENVAALVEGAMKKFNRIEMFPYDNCIDAITAYKLKRRRNR